MNLIRSKPLIFSIWKLKTKFNKEKNQTINQSSKKLNKNLYFIKIDQAIQKCLLKKIAINLICNQQKKGRPLCNTFRFAKIPRRILPRVG
jgi:hypothetical protein